MTAYVEQGKNGEAEPQPDIIGKPEHDAEIIIAELRMEFELDVKYIDLPMLLRCLPP